MRIGILLVNLSQGSAKRGREHPTLEDQFGERVVQQLVRIRLGQRDWHRINAHNILAKLAGLE
jgi:hypothetical protein